MGLKFIADATRTWLQCFPAEKNKLDQRGFCEYVPELPPVNLAAMEFLKFVICNQVANLLGIWASSIPITSRDTRA